MKHTFAAATLIAGLGAYSAHADLLAYEGFADYTEGDTVNGGLNGGFGFAGAWTVGQQGGNPTVYDESAAVDTDGTNGGELTWDGVFTNPAVNTSPNGSSRFLGQGPGTADRITADRVLSSSAGALAGGDNTLWASYILHMTGTNFGRHVGFSLGSDGMSNRSQNLGSGEGLGVGGAINTGLVTPVVFNSGAQDVRTTTGAPTVSFSEDNLIVLKFEFGATDTVTAYRFAESDTITEANFNAGAISATSTFNVDENSLNILSFSQSRGTGGFDEFKLGDSFADVTTGVPEPGSLALLGLGGLFVARRRRA